jgi:hypothetical protein
VTRGLRKIHNKELRDLYSSQSIILMINAYRILVINSEGKRSLGRPRSRLVDNIMMDLGEIGCGDVDWIGLAQDRDKRMALMNAAMNLRVP